MNICDYLTPKAHKLVIFAIVLRTLIIRLTANRPQAVVADPMDIRDYFDSAAVRCLRDHPPFTPHLRSRSRENPSRRFAPPTKP